MCAGNIGSFVMNNYGLNIYCHGYTVPQGYASSCPPLTNVTVIGIIGAPTHAELNGVSVDFVFNPTISELVLPSLNVKMSSEFVITWE